MQRGACKALGDAVQRGACKALGDAVQRGAKDMQHESKNLDDAAGGAAQVRNVCVGGQHVVGEVGVVVKVLCALVAKLVLGLVSRGDQVRTSLAQVHGHGAWCVCLVFGGVEIVLSLYAENDENRFFSSF